MKGQKKKQNGITLIALVISIIVMLILAGVSINALMGDNGILSQAQYASFISEMAAVEEAVQLWGANHYDDEEHSIPAKGAVQQDEIDNSERLGGEIGYYRTWSRTNTVPNTSVTTSADSFNNSYLTELLFFPGGVEDLYYLDNEGLDLSNSKKYVIDAENSMIYSVRGISLNGVRCYSLEMAKAVMNGTFDAPNFIASEVSGSQASGGVRAAGNTEPQYIEDEEGNLVENPNYNPNGFSIISAENASNVYKLYNNGELYGKGVKGAIMASTTEEMNELNSYVWNEWNVPDTIPGADTNDVKIYPKGGVIFVIDKNGYLWGWGSNPSNMLGLSAEQQIEFTGKIPVRLKVSSLDKKVKEVYCGGSNTFVITTDNELWAVGANTYGQLGVGTMISQENEWKKVNISFASDITCIQGDYFATLITRKNGTKNEYYATGYRVYLRDDTDPTSCPTTFERIFNTAGVDNFEDDIKNVVMTGHADYVFLNNGTGLVRCYGGTDGSPGTNSTSGTNGIWSVLNQSTYGTNIVSFHSYGNCGLIWRKNASNQDELWAVYNNSTSAFGITETSARTHAYQQITIPTSLATEGIKEIHTAPAGFFFLSNTGKLYGSGHTSGMGINNGYEYVSGIVDLGKTDVKTMYSYGNMYKNQWQVSVPFFVDNNGKLIITGGYGNIVFGEKVYQKNWKKLASNVSLFRTYGESSAAYIDKNKDIYVVGTSKIAIGLGSATEADTAVYTYTKITNTNIAGKAKDVWFAGNNTYILTTDGDVYGCGTNNKASGETAGWADSDTKYDYVKILSGIQYFHAYGNKRIGITSTGTAYVWGENINGQMGVGTGGRYIVDPYEYILPTDIISSTKTNNITQVETYGWQRTDIITKEGKVYRSGNWYNNAYDGIDTSEFGGTNYFSDCTSKLFTLESDEKIIYQKAMSDNTVYFLTDKGKLYGYGIEMYLGINSNYSTFKSIQRLDVDGKNSKIINIAVGSGFVIAVTEDGRVFATGNNSNGIMGRWVGTDRNMPNSRYRTSYAWVECPELEI